MMKMVRDMCREMYGAGEVRFSAGAVQELQNGANIFLDSVFRFAHALINYRNGKRFDVRDFRLAVELITYDKKMMVPWREKEMNRLHIHARHQKKLAAIEAAKEKYKNKD